MVALDLALPESLFQSGGGIWDKLLAGDRGDAVRGR